MRATGIVRRIDDLGRVVIPKEIRRNMRISEGDSLEIFTDNDGEIILKKYSPIGELGNFATQYADVLAKTSGRVTVITDKDSVIAVSGAPKRDFLHKMLSSEIMTYLDEKTPEPFIIGDSKLLNIIDGMERYAASVVCPIISDGFGIGTVIFLKNEKGSHATEAEIKLAQSAADFLAKQMDEQ